MGTSAEVSWRVSDIVRSDNHKLRPLDDPHIDPEPINFRYAGDQVYARVSTGYTTITYTVSHEKF